jgi:hypothetical protein
MRVSGLSIHDMDNVHPKGHQHIGDHSPMAAPPEELRVHDRGSKAPCECQKVEKTGGTFFTGQVVGVTPKCRMSPSRVRSIRDRLAASKVREPDVADPRSVERGLQYRLLILRLTAGAGKAPDIGDYLNPTCRYGNRRLRDAAAIARPATSHPLIAAAKYLSVPLLIGLPFGVSWLRMGFVVRGVFLVGFVATFFRLGWLYLIAPIRLRNNYALNGQQRLGRYMLTIGGGLLVWLTWKLLWWRFESYSSTHVHASPIPQQ